MEMLNMVDLVKEYSQNVSKFCVYSSLKNEAFIEELKEIHFFIKKSKIEKFVFNLKSREVVFIFDTEKEMLECFDQLEDKTALHVVAYSKGELCTRVIVDKG